MAWSDADLLETVQRLAAAPEVQVAWVKQLGSFPSLDELALEFDDEYWRVRDESADALPPGAHDALHELDRQLKRMSGATNAELWQPGALDGEEWNRVRELADRAVELMTSGGAR